MRTVVIVVASFAAVGLAFAQAPPPSAPSGQKTLASTVGVYAFPTKGQAPDQQSQDEAECYNWAVQQTGSDPFQLGKQAQQQQAQTEQAKQQAKGAGAGAGAKGAVQGAAAGALIGSVSHGMSAGEGAAYGAAAGVIAGRRQGKKAEKEAVAQVEKQGQAVQQATQQQLDGFKKAFSACLEAKDYMVKF